MHLFEVRQVSSVLHKVNKHPLPLFFVDLEPTEHSNDIYNLTSLLHYFIYTNKSGRAIQAQNYKPMFKLPRLRAHQILLRLPGTLCPLRCSKHDVRLPKLQRHPSQVRTLFQRPSFKLQRLFDLQGPSMTPKTKAK